GADLPDDVAAIFAMIGTDTAFARIMREAALPGTGIQRPHGVGAERTKTHRRNVEDRCRIRLAAIRAADGDAEFRAATSLRRHRMMHPFVTLAIDVLLGSERPLVELHLGALIDQSAGVAGERHAVLLALEEVLPDLRADLFKQEANMRRDRIVAQNRVVLLQEIANAEQRECAENRDRNQQDFPRLRVMVENPDTGQQGGYDGADRQHDVAWREWQQQRVHRTLSIILAGRQLSPTDAASPYDIRADDRGCDNGRQKYLRVRARAFAVQRNDAVWAGQWLCSRISCGFLPCCSPCWSSQASVERMARSI